MKLITLLLLFLLPLSSVAQDICVTFDCLVIKIEDNSTAKVYHVDSKATVTDNSVVVTIKTTTEEVMLFEQSGIKWNVGVNYLEHTHGDNNIKYYPRINNLVVTNNKTLVETTFYGSIPQLIEIKK